MVVQNETVISASGLSKNYEAKQLWQKLSFEINKGEMVAITGVSGSGKTTLLNCIGALEKADEGQITVAGVDLNRAGERQKRKIYKKTYGFLFQNYGLVDDWKVCENLDIAQEYQKISKLKKRQEQARVLEDLGIAELLQTKVYKLSGGEQQRVALARVILKNPEVILADEPTGSLDAKNAHEVIGILKNLARQGKTVIISTHDEVLVAECDRNINLSEA